MDHSKTNKRMDLSYILSSPTIRKDSHNNVKSKLDKMDQIINKMSTYNTTKVDLDQMNKDAKLEAKKGFYEDIECLQLVSGLSKFEDMHAFNKIASQINKGFPKESVFKNMPFLVFSKSDIYGNKNEFNEKQVQKILLNKQDKLNMFKTALKMISVETNLDNILTIKRIVIDSMICVSIADVYTTLIKILINFGIDLELMNCYVIKYKNIKDNALFKLRQPKTQDINEFDLNPIQSFIHIVDLIEISFDSTKIFDHQILADFVSFILILFSDQQWRFNVECLNALAHLLACVLRRAHNSTVSIKIISKAIKKFLNDKHSLFFEFLDFFPDNTATLTNIKFAICKIALGKYQIKIGHTEQKVISTFDRLKELKSIHRHEIKLIIAFINHFYTTRELNDSISQKISECLAAFVEEFEFESENQNSMELRLYLNSLIEQYNRKPQAEPNKMKRVRGECQGGRVRKIAATDQDIKKAWADFESEMELFDS